MKPPIQAVILAGGLGTRLGSKTETLPKPMMDIAGRPFLDYLVQNLRRQGVNEIVLSIGYLSDAIRSYFGTGENHGLSIRYAVEESPLGTGGALRNCLPMLRERFFVMNGDTLFDVNLAALANASPGNVMAMLPVDDSSRYGRVTLEDGRVARFEEKGDQGPGVINGGVLCLDRDVLAGLPDGKSSLEQDFLPRLVYQGTLSGFISNGFFIDIGVPDSLANAQSSIPRWEKKPIAFIDRDGVLNDDLGYVHTVEQFEWLDGAQRAVRYLNDAGCHVVLVTNQAGIAKGMYSEEDFHALTRWMHEELWKCGAHLDAVYYCPYHPAAILPHYRKASEDRKPGPGMLLRAMAELPCDTKRSFFIGNQSTDRQAADAASVQYFDFAGGDLLKFVQQIIRRTNAKSKYV
jgi:D,D-heptose 1,7-bisphosphate phosphatase